MPRRARVFDPVSGIYHVINRGNDRRTIFKDERDFREFLKILEGCKRHASCKLFHYVIMSNHYHLLLQADDPALLIAFMKRLGQQYSWWFRKRYGFIGHIWQGRYKSFVIHNDDYLIACGAYIEHNPVRAGITSDPSLYPWSSHRMYAVGSNDPLIDYDPFYEGMGKSDVERRKQYRLIHRT